MEEQFEPAANSRPLVCIFSDYDQLSLTVAELFLANFCRVNVISENIKDWQIGASHLSSNLNFLLTQSTKHQKVNANYVLFFSKSCYLDYGIPQNEFKKEESVLDFLKSNFASSTRLLYIFPYYQTSNNQEYINKLKEKYLQNHSSNETTLYIGKYVGPRADVNKQELISKIFKSVAEHSTMTLPSNKVELHLSGIKELANNIIKASFSFGSNEGRLCLLGTKMSVEDLAGYLQKMLGNIVLRKGGLLEYYCDPNNGPNVFTNGDINEHVSETVSWIRSSGLIIKTDQEPKKQINNPGTRTCKASHTSVRLPKIEPPPLPLNKINRATLDQPILKNKLKTDKALNKSRIVKKTIIALSATLIVFTTIPHLFLLGSFVTMFNSIKLMNKGNIRKTVNNLNISKDMSKTGSLILGSYTKVPLVGKYFNKSLSLTNLINETSTIFLNFTTMAEKSMVLVGKILGDETYDVGKHADILYLEMDNLYLASSHLEADIKNMDEKTLSLIGRYLDYENVFKQREKILMAKNITKDLPLLLGEEQPKTYLILFQNNMELRPTGGFIGSFALVTFDKGRMVNINVLDVYTADGQLKGYVKPPEPIKKYLGEAAWYLRDSNWDPDFPTSASRAEWFLDKEMEVKVDGVVSLDLEFIKDIIEITGPITVKDFNKTIDAQNFYETTQTEAEKDFFPGSAKKANFLSSLSKEMLDLLASMQTSNYFPVSKAILRNLEKRHVQVFIKQNSTQKALNNLGWDGAIKQEVCVGNCYSDWFGIVEANVGVNKSNFFVSRQAEYELLVTGSKIERRLSVSISSNANPALGYKGKYKVYLRVLSPWESVYQPVKIVAAGQESLVDPEVEIVNGRAEAGVLVEIEPGQTKKAVFAWSTNQILDFENKGTMALNIRKQAGVKEYPVNIRMSFPEQVYGQPSFSLTEQGTVGYNTVLSEDFSSRVFWE